MHCISWIPAVADQIANKSGKILSHWVSFARYIAAPRNISHTLNERRSNKAVPSKWHKQLLLRLPGRGSVKIYHFSRHFSLSLLSLLSSSGAPIWFKCSPPVLRLACKISLSSESAFCQHFMSKFTRVPSNRHEWTPRRFWFTIPNGTEANAPLAFYPWFRSFYSFAAAALRVNLSNLTLGRSSAEPRFLELGGVGFGADLHFVQSWTQLDLWRENSRNCHEESRRWDCVGVYLCR